MKHVTRITKHGDHHEPHERIQRSGGPDWSEREDWAIRSIERGAERYFSQVNGHRADPIVARHVGRCYLKT